MNQRDWHKLVAGQKSGLAAMFLYLPLKAAACAYSIIVRLRNTLYSKSLLKAHRADAVVISVGNVTVGGTGKTPLVIWLCNLLKEKNIDCAVLTRGYKAARNNMDEPAILAENCPQAKVIISPDRVEAAAEAVNRFGAKVLVMDDGFQHRRLARDLDIVTIDTTCPFGHEQLLPAGLLREPLVSLERADAAVLTRCDQVSESELNRIERRLQLINPNAVVAKSIHNPICAKAATGEEITIEQLKSRKIFAFCGIGNPDAFLNTIESTGTSLVGSKIYSDHYHYTDADIDDIYSRAERLRADLILSTQKDYTHYAARTAQYKIPFAYLAIEMKFVTGEDKLKQLIEEELAGKIHKKY